MADLTFLFPQYIEHAESEYRKTKHPLFVFEAYDYARAGNLPIPEWVLEYFDESARELNKWVRAAGGGDAIPDPNQKIAAAFGMAGSRGKNVFVEFANKSMIIENYRLAQEVAGYLMTGKFTETGAIDKVVDDLAAQFPASAPRHSKVRAAWKANRGAFLDALPK